MKLFVVIALASWFSSLALALAQDAAVSLRPGAVVRLRFPDLPPPLYAQARNDPVPAMLIAGRDEFTLEHFRQFYFVDGGAQFLTPFGLGAPELGKCRLLLLRADQGHQVTYGAGRPPWNVRPALDKIFDAVNEMALAPGLDWAQVVMRGRKHGFGPEFHVVVGQWARGEKLDDVPPKPAVPTSAVNPGLLEKPAPGSTRTPQ